MKKYVGLAASAALILIIGASVVAYNRLSMGNLPQASLADIAKADSEEALGVSEEASGVSKEASGVSEEASGVSEEASSDLEDSSENAPEENSFETPDFTVKDAEGNDVLLSDFFGKPIVLNFWASWCPPCKAEMPYFQTLYDEVGNDVHFIMLNATDGMRETKSKADEFITENGYTFPVFYDTDQDAVRRYGIRYYPTTVFIDAEGSIVTYAESSLDEETLRMGIDIIFSSKP